MLANTRRVYQLGTYSVELRPKGWFFWDSYKQDKSEAKGPYGSIASVTLMIARELKREITKRDAPYSLSQ